MPLHLTKIAFGAQSFDDIESWYAGRRSPHLTTKYRPTKWEDCIGGSLYWIHQHNLVAEREQIGAPDVEPGERVAHVVEHPVRVDGAQRCVDLEEEARSCVSCWAEAA